MQLHPGLAQALEPGAKQWCGFHIGGEDPPGGADKGVYAQIVNPLAQGSGVHRLQPLVDPRGGFPVAADEGLSGFGVGDIHAADPSQQELATHRGHGIEQCHPQPGPGDGFGSHETGGTATDNGNQR